MSTGKGDEREGDREREAKELDVLRLLQRCAPMQCTRFVSLQLTFAPDFSLAPFFPPRPLPVDMAAVIGAPPAVLHNKIGRCHGNIAHVKHQLAAPAGSSAPRRVL